MRKATLRRIEVYGWDARRFFELCSIETRALNPCPMVVGTAISIQPRTTGDYASTHLYYFAHVRRAPSGARMADAR